MAKKQNDASIMKDLEASNILFRKQEFLPTGILLLDAYMSGAKNIVEGQGFPIGKMISISGDNGIGKSTMMMELSRRWCMQGYKVLYIDVENGLNEKSLNDYRLLDYAARDIKDFLEGDAKFLPIYEMTYRKAMTKIRQIYQLNKVGHIDVIIIDSIKAMAPESLIYDDDDEYVEKQPMMVDARSQEYFLKKLKNFITCNNCVCILLNQLRMATKGQIVMLDEAGGQAFKHGMDIRLLLRQQAKIVIKTKDNLGEDIEKQAGNWVRIINKKGRFGNSFTELKLPLIFGKGVSLIYLYYKLLENDGYIKKGGSWYTFDISEIGLDKKVQSMANVNLVIKENIQQIEEFILTKGLVKVEESDEMQDSNDFSKNNE